MNNLKVLIADETPYIVRILGMTIWMHGYQTAIAPNIRSVPQQARDSQPDLIVLGLTGLYQTGIEALLALKTNSRTAHIPVIVTVPRDQKHQAAIAREIGTVRLFQKPFVPRDLALAIDEILCPAR